MAASAALPLPSSVTPLHRLEGQVRGIQRHINDESLKLIRRHEASLAADRHHAKNYERITRNSPKIVRRTPRHWSLDPSFHPYKVRSRRERIAEVVEESIRDRSYDPFPSLLQDIDKTDGGKRTIAITPVADAAVAKATYARILRRNESRLSPFSYAYRNTVGLHTAVERLWRVFRSRSRHYLVEFDFTKYFDTVKHDMSWAY